MKQSGVSLFTTPDTSAASTPKAAQRSALPPQRLKPRSYWLLIAVISVAYILAALVGELLRTPDSPASIVWPAAGLSLVALLIGGLRLWPGIWLGAFLYLFVTASPLIGVGISALIATGATLQALLGAHLTRRIYDHPSNFTRERDVARFLLLGGPLACLISPSVANFSLYSAGYLAVDQIASTWLLWWTADSMGVLLFAPLLLASPIAKTYLPKQSLRTALPLLITAVLLLSGNYALKRLEESQAHDDAEQMMEATYDSSFQFLSLAIEPLRGVERFFSASEKVTREEYGAFASYVTQQPAVLSVDWAPRVSHAERSAFEAQQQRENRSNYNILDRNSQGQLLPAGQREEYFPVSLTDPMPANSMILGHDHGSEPQRREAMLLARDSGEIVVTSIVPLLRTTEPSILAFTPVYHPDFKAGEASVEERRKALRGYTVGVFSIRQLLASADHVATTHELLYRVTDITAGEKPMVLLDTLHSDLKSNWSRRVSFANRTWQLEMQPATTYWQPWSSLPSRLYLGLSVLGAFLISLATLSAAGRNAATAVEVIERTAELARELQARLAAEQEVQRLNLDLKHQVEEKTVALEALHNKEEELSAIVDNLPFCLISINAKGIVQSANPALETMLGYRPDELIGQNISLIMPEPDRSRHGNYISHYLRTGEAHVLNIGREVQGLHKDGHLIPLELTLNEFEVRGERFFVGSLYDVSERKRFIDELTRARFDAEQASRAKSSFLAIMSHEIRTPMNGVLGLVDVLAHSHLSEYQADLISTIRESATSLLNIIDDILDFSKIEAGRMSIERNPIYVADIVEKLCSALHPDAVNKGVEMSLFISPQIPERLLSDTVRLRQVLFNLIGNAIKFSANQSQRKGCVAIRVEVAETDPLRLSFQISDNGIGMTRGTLDTLFAPFTQAEVSTTRRFGGTGLGLAISKRLIDLMEGEITVTSHPGTGTTFLVSLPFEITAEQPLRTPPELEGITCIIVSTTDFNTADLCAYVEDAGARILMANDTTSAAKLAESEGTPLVVIQYIGHNKVAVTEDLASVANVRNLLITRGRRQRARVEANSVVTLDYPLLRRQALLNAVSLASGRASQEFLHKNSTVDLIGEVSPPSRAEARAQNKLILIAEDDQLNQRVISQQLALLGYAAEIACNGVDALTLWREGSYALLLTDLYMPDMDGYSLARAIRSEEAGESHIPILALTANALVGEADQALAAGIDEYLTKPVQLHLLREVLEKWLPKKERKPAPLKPARLHHIGPPVDVTVLHDMVGDDPDIVQGLLSDYLESLRHLADELRLAYASGDIRQVCDITHKLKSSSRLIGALGLGDLCSGLEKSGKSGNTVAIDEAMPHFQAAVAEVEAELTRILKQK